MRRWRWSRRRWWRWLKLCTISCRHLPLRSVKRRRALQRLSVQQRHDIVGSVLVHVNSERVSTVAQRAEQLVAGASTAAAFDARVSPLLLAGSPNTPVEVEWRTADGKTHTHAFFRSAALARCASMPRAKCPPVSVLAAEPSGSERQHRAQPFAARLDQVGRHFGNPRRVFRRHPLADQLVHLTHFAGQRLGEAIMRLLGGCDVHPTPAARLDNRRTLPLHPLT